MAIQNSLEKLRLKIIDLEEKINNITSKKEAQSNSGVYIFQKELLNFKISKTKTVRIKTLDNILKNQIFVQLKLAFYNFSQQDIKFSLLADKIQIAQEIKNCSNGLNEILIFGTYHNQVSDKIQIDVSVTPHQGKQITLFNATLTIWGISTTEYEEYHALETTSDYFLSYISNGRLYYKIFNKNTDAQSINFQYFSDANSHSSCCANDEIYLFRVDPDRNLFFSNFSNINEIFIAKNVSNVACCYYNNSIIFCYITNGDAFYGEIKNNIVISNKQINSLHGKFISCYLYFNNLNSKTYLILTKKDQSNYLLESIANTNSSSENIYAISNLNISIT